MKKTYTSKEINQKQGQELSKKLYRSISEYSKCLDDARSCARSIGDLFVPNLQIQRNKLRDYCERLIFSEPALYGRKTEELLWRKCYYDVISQAKKLKNKEYGADERANIHAHLNAGVGFYHHILSKLQLEFHLNITNSIDFPLSNDNKLISGKDTHSYTPEDIQWAKHAVHQSLIYLGDLNRYKLEIFPNLDTSLTIRYYLQAASFNPQYGMPHNQMGTLAMSRNDFLDAVYHYMRCLACKHPFDGTKNNLHNLFDKNTKFIEQLPEENDDDADCIIELDKSENIKRFIAKFLQLIDTWYFDKKLSKVYNWCHQTFKDLEKCLTYLKATVSESDESPSTDESIETGSNSPTYLNNDILFKIVVICLLTITKLRSNNSPQLSTVVAFTLAIYSQLLRNISNHIQESVLNYPLSEEHGEKQQSNGILKKLMRSKKKNALKFRRRKKVTKNDSEESDLSETEHDSVDYNISDDSLSSSEDENVLVDSSDDEDASKLSEELDNVEPIQNGVQNKTTENNMTNEEKTETEVIRKVQRMDVNDMLEIIMEETPLQCIKILNDWLKYDKEVVKSCGNNTRNLMHQITYLLNLININLSHSKINGVNVKISEILSKETKIPLTEDIQLKGMDILANVQNELDWNYLNKRSFNLREETITRIVKLISFGKFLTNIEETGVHFHDEKNVFICDAIDDDDNKLPATVMEELNLQDDEHNGGVKETNGDEYSNKDGQLMKMKHMGQLWLAAEVRALESRVKGKPSLSPYLVLDADALIKYTFMVKHLVNSRKFIVLVPTAVVNALDDLKREKIEARDAIRWLEAQFHRGNRFFRAQRQHERAPLPFIKYPKKKDKEMYIYIQIIECCNFLTEQQKGASNLVTLLIGNHNVLSNGENREFSYVGLAQSAGIAIESITHFYGKWKKSKGKR